MNIVDIIDKKRLKKELSNEEIKFVIKNYTNDEIKDYQMAAFLMAVVLNGMTYEESFLMTKEMVSTGEMLDLSTINKVKVDKHSTGGLGDKTTLIIAPILASLGLVIPKMSGRGLGYTGGTIDKLESIKNFNTNKTLNAFLEQIEKENIGIIGQTEDFVLADKKIYALRDVTATVDSIPLIASSIMSKKIAMNADLIVIDIKVGDGAFMKNEEKARELAKVMISIGEKFHKNVIVFLTEMNYPLGLSVGNGVEVIEAVEVLRGNGEKRLKNYCFNLCAEILHHLKLVDCKCDGLKLVKENIGNGEALEKFTDFVVAQGGDASFVDDYEKICKPKYIYEIKANKRGVISNIKALDVGKIVLNLGGGRLTKGDIIDHHVGVVFSKSVGEKVERMKLFLECMQIRIFLM